MLPHELLTALETANGTAGLDGAKAHRCPSGKAIRATCTEPATSAFVRFGTKPTEQCTPAQHAATGLKPNLTPQPYQHTWVYAPLQRASLLCSSRAPSAAHRLGSREEPPRTHHHSNTPAGELGLDLGPLHSCLERAPGHCIYLDAMDSDEDSLITHDTVYDTILVYVYETIVMQSSLMG